MNVEATSIEADRTWTIASYVLHLIGAVAGITSIIGLVINYLKRGDHPGLLDSHHRWMIRSFWWAIVWIVVGFVTFPLFFIGWVVWCVTWIWYLYRHIRGLIALTNNQPMPG